MFLFFNKNDQIYIDRIALLVFIILLFWRMGQQDYVRLVLLILLVNIQSVIIVHYHAGFLRSSSSRTAAPAKKPPQYPRGRSPKLEALLDHVLCNINTRSRLPYPKHLSLFCSNNKFILFKQYTAQHENNDFSNRSEQQQLLIF